ncbi:MAG: aminoacyl-histidine dipeptidase [Bacteroidales bacterium]|nr:aminoacyl-histidine dipeptidase [Bacteroidales bacterium]
MTSAKVLAFFDEILRIPRESGHEEQIIAYLQNWAAQRGLECQTDAFGNVLIRKEAAKGCESMPTLILQSHSDMVCEKNKGVEHDFAKDPIKAVVKDGWLIAENTTLGADCGIGIAATLAVLDDEDLPHGPLECLFTSSEETGMDGAFGLSPELLKGSILINLDSEDEGELFIGCSGGLDTTAVWEYKDTEALAAGSAVIEICFEGGIGGHSGDDIHKGRSNAIQSLARSLWRIWHRCPGAQLLSIDGGNKRNAIAREAKAVIALPAESVALAKEIHLQAVEEVRSEYAKTDSGITGTVVELPDCGLEGAIPFDVARGLIHALCGAPHGVLAMSAEVHGLVQLSTNLASVKMPSPGVIRIGTSQRSAVASERRWAGERVEAAFAQAGAVVTHNGEYPGWTPSMKSRILDVTRQAYKDLFKVEPVIRAIHAGLECGLIIDKYPQMDAISFGPTLRGVHAPGERLDLASLDKFVLLLEEVIRKA